jgi:CRP/FNR family transcriptional regulator, cyclic AMP receptor protein
MDLSAFREHPFVETLSDEQAQRLLACAREVDFDDGAIIFREGEGADTQYLVRDGCVVLEQHVPGRGAVRVETLRAGDILGLSWLFPENQWTLDARCVGPVRAFALGADCLRERMRADPALAVELLNHVARALYERLLRVRLQRLDIYKAGV